MATKSRTTVSALDADPGTKELQSNMSHVEKNIPVVGRMSVTYFPREGAIVTLTSLSLYTRVRGLYIYI